MDKKIVIFCNYNLYESKRYFADKFKEALIRQGFQVRVIDSEYGVNVNEVVKVMTDPKETSLTCSFNSILPMDNGQYLYDLTHIPHWSILVDPSFYSAHLFRSPYSIVSCVDHYDCQFGRLHNFENVFFWPHAVERELAPHENQEKKYDVVFFGSCYDHENLKKYWRSHFPTQEVKVIEDSVDILLSDNKTPLVQAVRQGMLLNGVEPSEIDMEKIVFHVDSYARGKDRFELIKSIKDVQVHVFGGICWRDVPPVQGWANNLAAFSNVTVHPAMSFPDSLEILKQSKICLNSMPFFKDGTHERIFTGLATGCVPITMDNLWVRENFVDDEELIIYKAHNWSEMNEKVNFLIANEQKRQEIACKGREKVMAYHTWDNRVEEMSKALKSILGRIN